MEKWTIQRKGGYRGQKRKGLRRELGQRPQATAVEKVKGVSEDMGNMFIPTTLASGTILAH